MNNIHKRLQYTQYSPPRLERCVLFDKVIIIISSFHFSVLHSILLQNITRTYTRQVVLFFKKKALVRAVTYASRQHYTRRVTPAL